MSRTIELNLIKYYLIFMLVNCTRNVEYRTAFAALLVLFRFRKPDATTTRLFHIAISSALSSFARAPSTISFLNRFPLLQGIISKLFQDRMNIPSTFEPKLIDLTHRDSRGFLLLYLFIHQLYYFITIN